MADQSGLKFASFPDEQTVIGVSISGELTRASAVLGVVRGRGFEARLDVRAVADGQVPEHYTEMFQALDRGAGDSRQIALLTTGLAQLAAGLVNELASPAELADTLAVGIVDPGLWRCGEAGPESYLSLCDGAQIAEATGLTVIDAFPARDVALGGQGGPLEALPLWMLLHDAKKSRVLVDLGRTTRLYYLPASCEGSGAARVLGLEIAPGTRLLDRLTQHLTEGKQAMDVGGKLGAQGRVVPEIIDYFFQSPALAPQALRWRPRGMPIEWFYDAALRRAPGAGWTVGDLLTSATQFIALAVQRSIAERVPKLPPLEQLIVMGQGHGNGLLLQTIGERLPDLEILPIARLGLAPERVDAATAALLALLHAEQLPAVTTLISGLTAPRILGRLTPGTPQSWQRFLRQVSARQPLKMSLRSAI